MADNSRIKLIARQVRQDEAFDRAFEHGREQALREFGVGSSVGGDVCEGVILVGAEADGRLVGGYRLHPGTDHLLPLEAINGRVAHGEQRAGLAELGGVWCRRERRKTGLSSLLLRDAVRRPAGLGVELLYLFAHQKVLPLYEGAGWDRDPRFAEVAAYPTDAYISFVMRRWCLDRTAGTQLPSTSS